ncbi:unnamed protein product [Discula destructiva]
MAVSQDVAKATSDTRDVVVTEVPKIDLESYVQNYTGRTRTARLMLIARSSTVLGLDALKLASRDAISRNDVQLYRDVIQAIRAIDPNDPATVCNNEWAEATEKTNKAELTRLETELKGYKNNLIKESIRMGNEDLAKHYEKLGELSLAYEVYSKMRADVTASKQIIEGGLHLARVSVLRRDWAMVITNVNKITSVHMMENNDKTTQSLSNIYYGIGHLGQSKYAEASQAFLRVDPSTSASLYDEVASPNDIATYGGLLALATMNRQELSRFLDSSPFRPFLELEPHFRRAISQFVNGRYSACLAILESYRADYLLDIYLEPHVTELYRMIRTKCIFHFLQPFSCVTIDSMNAAFAAPGESVEEELIDMIRVGGLQARIDPIDRVITTIQINPRAQMQAEALAAARQYEKDAVDRIRRINLISAHLEVRGKHKGGGARAGGPNGPSDGPLRGAHWDGAGNDLAGYDDYSASSFVASQY